VAGKRAGLKHEANGDEETTRSGLFMEAVRIIKEMRQATNGKYPRFALWENVPGAFSSNKGEDFRVVCEELIKIVEPAASMPGVPKNGWAYADYYHGDGWSLAYRVLDAQYWGVPQRRRRIYLVADFRGERAKEVLFEREGLRGYFATGRTPWQTTPADAQSSTGADDREGECDPATSTDPVATDIYRGCGDGAGDRGLDAVGVVNAIGGNAENSQETKTFPTLTNGTAPGFQNAVVYSFDSLASNSMKSANPNSGCREVEVAKTLDTSDQNPSKNQGGVAVVQPLPYTMKIRSGCAVDANGKAAGKGALIQTDKAATLSTVQDQYLFQPVDPTFIIDNVGGQAEYAKVSNVNGTLRAGAQGLVAYAIENHPADSRVNIDESGRVQTLTSRMGTGGGNVPMVMEPFCKSARANELVVMATQQGGAEIRTDGKAPTLTAAAGMSGNNQPVICLQGNGIDRADTAGCNGKGWKEDTSYTLNTIDRPAVVYAIDQQGGKGGANYAENIMPTLCSDSHGTPHGVAYGLDRASFNQGQNAQFDFSVKEEQQPTLTARGPGAVCCTTGSYMQTTENVSPTLMARDWKDPTCVCTNYIVRRLTPTECARLQGFADQWGCVEKKDCLTDEEYKFWLEVRNTHAAINGRKVQDYTAKQMLTWYNKLWTDSSEYKMWGNGIALPTALYCLQGVLDALTTEDDLDDWMN
jgi:DNA (cytosine-5)-methyltransferase 1